MPELWPLLALIAFPLLVSSGVLPVLAVAAGLLGMGLVVVGLLGMLDARRRHRARVADPPELDAGHRVELGPPAGYRGRRRRPRTPRARRKPRPPWVPVRVARLVELARRESQLPDIPPLRRVEEANADE